MNTLEEHPIPFDWVKNVEATLVRNDTFPIFGNAPVFPWNEFNALLSRSLKHEDLKIAKGEVRWREGHGLAAGLGENPRVLHFAIPSIDGDIAWIMAEKEIATIASIFLTQAPPATPYYDAELLDGFQSFLAAEVLNSLDRLRYLQSLIPQITNESTVPTGECLTVDIDITFKDKDFGGRLCLSKDFHNSWRQYHAQRKPPLNADLLEKLDVHVATVVGQVSLSKEEWDALKDGDIIFLDRCTVDPETLEGTAAVTVNGQTIFEGKLTDTGVTIMTASKSEEEPVVESTEDEEEKPEKDLESADTKAKIEPEVETPSTETEDEDIAIDDEDDFDDDDLEVDDDDFGDDDLEVDDDDFDDDDDF